MSNPTKIYNDYVRANLPNTMTFDTTTDRYDINNHSFFSFNKANWYFKYVTKFGYASGPTFTTEFAMTIATTGANETFTIPCQNNGTFNADIEWGDGSVSTVTSYNDANLTHTYATAGDHLIRITGSFPNIRFNNAGDKLKVKSVENLGIVGWTKFERAFRGCTNMTSFTAGTTDTSSVVNMVEMFRDCTSLTSLDVSSFDTSSVTVFSSMFRSCSSLTSLDVTNFDTSSASGSNGIQGMFQQCSSLTSLDVSNFDTSLATNFSSVFRQLNLTSLDVSNIDTSSATYLGYMFADSNNLTSLDLSNFDTSSTQSMRNMLNCSSLTSIVGAEDFDITSFNATNGLNNFMDGNGKMTTAQYDALLVKWDAQSVLSNLSPNFGASQYTAGSAAATARANLISNDGWTITDGGTA